MLVPDQYTFALFFLTGWFVFFQSINQTHRETETQTHQADLFERLVWPVVGIVIWALVSYMGGSLSNCSSAPVSACTGVLASPLSFPLEVFGWLMAILELLIAIIVILLWSGKYFVLPAKQLQS